MAIDVNSQRQLSDTTGELALNGVRQYREGEIRLYYGAGFEMNSKSRPGGET
jgi:hypothetical protein